MVMRDDGSIQREREREREREQIQETKNGGSLQNGGYVRIVGR